MTWSPKQNRVRSIWLLAAVLIVLILAWATWASAAWTPKPPGVGTEIDPSVNTLGRATLPCTIGQIPKVGSAGWGCSSDLTSETGGDMAWEAWKLIYDGDANDKIDASAVDIITHALHADDQDLSGYATLVEGKVPTSQLPGTIDEIIEYATSASFPVVGINGVLYVTLDTNLVYRWSGSAYTLISSSLALGETSSTAYRGDRGTSAYNHSISSHAPTTAEANVQADWTQASTLADSYINNKPTTWAETAIAFTDLTTNNASTTKHGYFPKLPASTGKVLKDDLSWLDLSPITNKTNLITVTQPIDLGQVALNNSDVTFNSIKVTADPVADGKWGQFVFLSDTGTYWMLFHPEADMTKNYIVGITNATGTIPITVTAPTAGGACTVGTMAVDVTNAYFCPTGVWKFVAIATLP